jgi:hypothetical protein
MNGEYQLTEEDARRLERNFTYHVPKGTQPARYHKIRAKSKELAEMILRNCPCSDERSEALASLDSVVMQANAAIARNE